MRKNLGFSLFAIWLIITALMSLLHLGLPYASLALNLLALVAGVFILAGK